MDLKRLCLKSLMTELKHIVQANLLLPSVNINKLIQMNNFQ